MWTPDEQRQAKSAIQYFSSTRQYEAAIQLLDKMAQMTTDSETKSQLIEAVVASWQKSDTSQIRPEQMLKHLERYQKQTQITLQTYTMILDVANKRGGGGVVRRTQDPSEFAEKILFTVQRSPHLVPDSVFLATLLYSYTKCTLPDAASRVTKYFRQFKALATPIASQYASVTTTLAMKSGGAQEVPQQVEELMGEMQAVYGLAPDIQAYCCVLNAWAESSHPRAAQICLQKLQELKQMPNIQPNAVAYGTVLKALARKGLAEQAEQLLLECLQRHESTQREEDKPTVITFTSCLHAWSKSRHPQAGARAEALLESMVQKYDIKPNLFSFNAVLDAWARSKAPEAADRAEAILNHMQQLYEQGNEEVKPNSFSMTIVMNAWAKNARTDSRAAPRAHSILDLMCRLYRQGDLDMKPDIVGFTTVMDCYAKSGRRDAPQKVRCLLEQMQIEYGILPSVFVFSVAINAWTRCGTSAKLAVENAELLMEEARRCASTNSECTPNIVLYNSLIDCYAKAALGNKAEEMMESMQQEGIHPSVITYNSVMAAWVKSGEDGSIEKVENLLKHMRDNGVRPDAVTFGNLITAWAKNINHPLSTERALEYLEELKILYKEGDKNCKPNTIVYSSTISALSHSHTMNKQEAADQAMELLNEMRSYCQPNAITYRSVLNCVVRTKDPAKKAFAILTEMDENKVAPMDPIHFELVLHACAWTKSNDLRFEALQIAKQVYGRIRKPSARTFEYMIWAAAGLDSPLIETLYEDCHKYGFESCPRVSLALRRFAPHLITARRDRQ
jgi:pentatricopeptide repeat protein